MPKNESDDNQPLLPNVQLPLAPDTPPPMYRRPSCPLWTENKAKLIERYLYYFVLITHHGTYIDGFAGPQSEEHADVCAAKLVLESKPAWMRNFYLYDLDPKKCRILDEIKEKGRLDDADRKPKRNIETFCGDFNRLVMDLLDSKSIGPKEAAFCLLDQRTFECKWSTVRAIANYQNERERKIELFYFLPNFWQNRALAALGINKDDAREWWGYLDANTLQNMGPGWRREVICRRFRDELGYKHVTPWPIYQKPQGGGAIMYYMIHATDHDVAPELMNRAYINATKRKESPDEVRLLFPNMFDPPDK